MKILSTLFTAAVGKTGGEALTGGAIAAAGTAVSVAFGGWDAPLRMLITLMILDYASGVLGAIKGNKGKKLDSTVMFWGGIRKGVVLAVIFLAVQLDLLLGGDSPVFRTIAVYFYAGREALSVVENFGVLGVPLPGALKKKLEQLQEKGDATDGK